MKNPWNKPPSIAVKTTKTQKAIQDNSQKTKLEQARAKAKKRPEWNDGFNEDTNKYKLTEAEVMRKKMSLVSKNHAIGRDEWRQKQLTGQTLGPEAHNPKKYDEDDILHSIRRQKSLNRKRNPSCNKQQSIITATDPNGHTIPTKKILPAKKIANTNTKADINVFNRQLTDLERKYKIDPNENSNDGSLGRPDRSERDFLKFVDANL